MMNKYEKFFAEVIQQYTPNGIWIINSGLMIGFNYMEIQETDCGFNDFCDEMDERSADDMTIEDYFECHPNMKFCFVLEKAILGNFITWKEFCKRVDNKESFDDVFSM